MKRTMISAGVPAKCAITGYTDLGGCEAAPIFPECWINDGTYKTRLSGYLPTNKITKGLLNGPTNRIIMTWMVHTFFDGKSKGAAKLGRWSLAEKLVKKTGLPVPNPYEIVVKPGHVKAMKDVGVVDRAVVKLPHVDSRLLAWHLAQFAARLPTAGADVSDSDDDDDDRGFVDPVEAVGASETLRSFGDDDVKMYAKRVPLPEHRLLACH
jgi:hypothetical protein